MSSRKSTDFRQVVYSARSRFPNSTGRTIFFLKSLFSFPTTILPISQVGSLIYDGLHVMKNERLGNNPNLLLKKWSSHILHNHELHLEIKIKDFEIDPTWLEPYSSSLSPTIFSSSAKSADFWDDDWMSEKRMLSYKDMKEAWERRSFKIVVMSEFARHENTMIAVYNKTRIIDAYEHLQYVSVDENNGVIEKPFMKAWIRDKGIRTFKFMNSYPPPMVCPPDQYNTWSDFDIATKSASHPAELSDSDLESMAAYLNHFKILLPHTYEYVINMFAQMFQEPSRKIGIALILKGLQGVGKNRLLDLIKVMMGFSKYLETSRPEHDIYGRFTDARRDKVLIVVNEASRRANVSNDDQLKDMITSETFTCEAKGRDQIKMNCFCRLIFTTNSDNIIKISQPER